MREVRFTVLGEPVSKERPRVTRNGTYTPKRTMDAEKSVRAAYRAAVGHVSGEPELLQGNIEAKITFYNGNRRRRDLDNMTKLVLDALNGVAYADDVQVHRKHVEKHYTSKDRARTEVTLKETAESFQEGDDK